MPAVSSRDVIVLALIGLVSAAVLATVRKGRRSRTNKLRGPPRCVLHSVNRAVRSLTVDNISQRQSYLWPRSSPPRSEGPALHRRRMVGRVWRCISQTWSVGQLECSHHRSEGNRPLFLEHGGTLHDQMPIKPSISRLQARQTTYHHIPLFKISIERLVRLSLSSSFFLTDL
jgi:hypothetical protein